MEVPGIRPRFRFHTPMEGAEITRRIGERIRQENPSGLWLKNAGYHITLNFPQRTAEAWTPQMDINFEVVEDGRTLVRCLIGPPPGIWMLFAAGYIGMGLLFLVGIALGLAQRMTDHTPWGFFLVPLAMVCAAAMAYLEHLGRIRARPGMHVLKRFVDDALGCDCLKLAEE